MVAVALMHGVCDVMASGDKVEQMHAIFSNCPSTPLRGGLRFCVGRAGLVKSSRLAVWLLCEVCVVVVVAVVVVIVSPLAPVVPASIVAAALAICLAVGFAAALPAFALAPPCLPVRASALAALPGVADDDGGGDTSGGEVRACWSRAAAALTLS